ncbi:hypothetical protein V2J09_010860, partial [Rumex salicifolius]
YSSVASILGFRVSVGGCDLVDAIWGLGLRAAVGAFEFSGEDKGIAKSSKDIKFLYDGTFYLASNIYQDDYLYSSSHCNVGNAREEKWGDRKQMLLSWVMLFIGQELLNNCIYSYSYAN